MALRLRRQESCRSGRGSARPGVAPPVHARVLRRWQPVRIGKLGEQADLIDVPVAHHKVHALGVARFEREERAQEAQISRPFVDSVPTEYQLAPRVQCELVKALRRRRVAIDDLGHLAVPLPERQASLDVRDKAHLRRSARRRAAPSRQRARTRRGGQALYRQRGTQEHIGEPGTRAHGRRPPTAAPPLLLAALPGAGARDGGCALFEYNGKIDETCLTHGACGPARLRRVGRSPPDVCVGRGFLPHISAGAGRHGAGSSGGADHLPNLPGGQANVCVGV